MSPFYKQRLLALAWLGATLGIGSCGGRSTLEARDESLSEGDLGSEGGRVSVGGPAARDSEGGLDEVGGADSGGGVGSGGDPSSGGSYLGAGGAQREGGGAPSAGGAIPLGGQLPAAGAPGEGGTPSSGGVEFSGGLPSAGGVTLQGGSTSLGGMVLQGGAPTGGAEGGASGGGMAPEIGGTDTGGALEPVCDPTNATDEICNGLDDDCDGMIDEGLGLAPQTLYDIRTTELATGDCVSCYWAFGDVAWQTDEGIFVVFRIGFYGSQPQPNAFLGGLTPDFVTLPPQTLFETNVTVGFEIAVGPERIALTTCARFDNRDRPAVFWLDHAGNLLSGPELLTTDTQVACYQAAPGATWTGERFLLTWYANGPTMISVRDADGGVVSESTLLEEGSAALPGRFAVSGDRVLGLFDSSSEPHTRYLISDLEGQPLSEPWSLESLGGSLREARLSPTANGWLLAGKIQSAETMILLGIDQNGEPAEPSTFDGSDYGLSLTPIPLGGHLLVSSSRDDNYTVSREIRRLDDNGTVLDEWTSEPTAEGYFRNPFVLASEAGSYVLFAEPCEDYEPNAVRLMRIGCNP